MIRPRIIGLCGCKRSGKDTVADFITTQYGYTHVKFAQVLKDTCRVLFGLSHGQVEGDDKDTLDERYGCTPRKMMQFLGTEVMQYKIQELLPGVGRMFWVDDLLARTAGQYIVISDVRFVHEADAIMKSDPHALIIKVERPRGSDRSTDCHPSEQEVEQIKGVPTVLNDSTIEELHAKVRRLITLSC